MSQVTAGACFMGRNCGSTFPLFFAFPLFFVAALRVTTYFLEMLIRLKDTTRMMYKR